MDTDATGFRRQTEDRRYPAMRHEVYPTEMSVTTATPDTE